MSSFDYDFAVIGSGFGGSVAALRLAEKGYKVVVLEMGKRWRPEDFAKTSWDLRKFLWRPEVGLHGILQMTVLSDIFFLHGAGVGGGSLVYANTLLQPPAAAFADAQWVGQDWQRALAPHYETAKRMLGATRAPQLVETDLVLKKVAGDLGRAHTFHHANVGVYFGEPGKTAADPYFGGDGPARTGCIHCGACMIGCRFDAKNSLDKNYLYLAEKRGTVIVPEARVTDVRALEKGEGGGYALTYERSTGVLHPKTKLRARGVVFAAGAYGTVDLLTRCKERGSLARISSMLGHFVRTNSEALLAVRSRKKGVDYSKGIAITSGAYVDEKTHVEIVRYPAGSDLMAMLTTVLTDGGGKLPRPLRMLVNAVKRPSHLLRTMVPFGWAKKTAILLVMQPVDNHLRLRMRRPWYWPFGKRLDSDRGAGAPAPVYIPIANEIARRMAKEMDGVPQSGVLEVAFGKASTAHLLGGCPIGETADTGVVDTACRVFGHDDLYVVDGSVVPANLGVNPSLTITAIAEHAMSLVAPKVADYRANA